MVEKTILVIDDDWMNREAIEAHLQIENYKVTTTSSGREGLNMAFAHPPDLIILDGMLPDISGFEVCRQLKNHPLTRLVPVMIVTALESDEDKHKGIAAGADDFLSKPFSFILLLARVKTLVQLKQLQENLQESYSLLERLLKHPINAELIRKILHSDQP
ncbi:MAG: response regulator [Anaerolineae bacterium]|nr:response regulator [Anaerolineae bacterium]